MGFKTIKELNVENIESSVNHESMFKTYCKNFKKVGGRFRSELREDNNPSCVIYNNDGRLVYVDLSTGDKYSPYQYIMTKYGVDFITSLAIVNRDFGLDMDNNILDNLNLSKQKVEISDKSSVTSNKNIRCRIRERDFNQNDFLYWGSHGISKSTLNLFSVKPISRYWIRYNSFNADEIAYAYCFNNEHYDIYQPYNKDFKWGGNCKSHHIYGLQNAYDNRYDFDVLYIVSSLKEVMMLWEQYNILAIAPRSESSMISDELIVKLKKFFKINVLLDFDRPGIVSAIKHSKKYQSKMITSCPVLGYIYGGKDLTDIYKNGDRNFLKRIIKDERYIIKVA